MNEELRKELMAMRIKSHEDDAASFRNLLKARTMKALGVEDEIYEAIIVAFERQVENEVHIMVGGS